MISEAVILELAARLQRGEPVTVEAERLAVLLAAITLWQERENHTRVSDPPDD